MNPRRRRHINLSVQRDRNRVAADVHAARAATSTGSADQRPPQPVEPARTRP